MRDEFKKAAARRIANPNEIVTLFYSETAAKYFGATVGSIPDGRGGTGEVAFTQLTADKEIASFAASVPDGKGGRQATIAHVVIGSLDPKTTSWPDETIVWQGRRADLSLAGIVKPELGTPFRAVTDLLQHEQPVYSRTTHAAPQPLKI